MDSITQYAIDFIFAKVVGGKVWMGNLTRYKTRYEVLDFADDDLVTKYYVDSVSDANGSELTTDYFI